MSGLNALDPHSHQPWLSDPLRDSCSSGTKESLLNLLTRRCWQPRVVWSNSVTIFNFYYTPTVFVILCTRTVKYTFVHGERLLFLRSSRDRYRPFLSSSSPPPLPLLEACKTWGFFHIVNHNIDTKTPMEFTRQFFDLSLERKLAVSRLLLLA